MLKVPRDVLDVGTASSESRLPGTTRFCRSDCVASIKRCRSMPRKIEMTIALLMVSTLRCAFRTQEENHG